MAIGEANVEVVRREDQWEARGEGGVGVLTYEESGGKLFLLHTEVPEAMAGGGVGARLVRTAAEYAREKGLTIVPFCPFAKAYLQRHRDEYGDLVAPGM